MITFLHDKMKGLLLVLLAVIAISFIFFGNWTPSGAVDPASGKMGRIGGHTLTFNELVAAQRQTLLEITLETGRIPSDNDRLIAIQTWVRLLQNQAAENAGIQPQPDQLLPSRILAASPHLQQNLDALKKVYLECDDAICIS